MSDDKPSLHDIAMQKAKSQSTTPEQQHEADVRKLQQEIMDKFLKDVGIFAKRAAQKLEKANVPKVELKCKGSDAEGGDKTFLGLHGKTSNGEYGPIHSIQGWHIAFIASGGTVRKRLDDWEHISGNLTNFLAGDGRMMFATTTEIFKSELYVGTYTYREFAYSEDCTVGGGIDISTFDQKQAYDAFVRGNYSDSSASKKWLWGDSTPMSFTPSSFYDNPNVIIRGWEAAVEDLLRGSALIQDCEMCSPEKDKLRTASKEIAEACRRFYKRAIIHHIPPNVGRMSGSFFNRTVDVGWTLDYSVDYSYEYGVQVQTEGSNLIVSLNGEIMKGYARIPYSKEPKGAKLGCSYFKEYRIVGQEGLDTLAYEYKLERVRESIKRLL
jgi:hypothetical protein